MYLSFTVGFSPPRINGALARLAKCTSPTFGVPTENAPAPSLQGLVVCRQQDSNKDKTRSAVRERETRRNCR